MFFLLRPATVTTKTEPHTDIVNGEQINLGVTKGLVEGKKLDCFLGEINLVLSFKNECLKKIWPMLPIF